MNRISNKFGSKSFKQKDGTKVTVGFDVSYKHHDSEESAKNALDDSPGDNIMQVDTSLNNWEMNSFPFSGQTFPANDTYYGVTIRGGKEANSRGKDNGFYI